MATQHGTTTETKLTSYITVQHAVEKALATVVEEIGVKPAIDAVDRKGDLITDNIRLMFIALQTGQTLVLQAPEKAPEPKLLELVKKVSTTATEKFAAAEHFKKGTTKGVQIAWLGDDFKSAFGKKVEENVPAGSLLVHTLLRASLDPPIITALGDNHETTLAELWQLLAAQPNGENGTLLTNGYANIFYIRDTEGTLWAVGALWSSDGWDVYANSVEDPCRWGSGFQVLSRDSKTA